MTPQEIDRIKNAIRHIQTAKGWSELCELMSHCMDDDQPEEWIYDGNGRPKACPLVEVKEDTDE